MSYGSSLEAYIINQPLEHGLKFPLVASDLETLHEFAIKKAGLTDQDFKPHDPQGFPCYHISRDAAFRIQEQFGLKRLAAVSRHADDLRDDLSRELARHPELGSEHAASLYYGAR